MNHSKEKQFYEMRAKLTLERIPKLGYGQLIMSEKPDLLSSDGKYGIEVTRAIDNHDAEQIAIYQKLFDRKQIDEISPKNLELFCKDGSELLVTGDFNVEPPNIICGFSHSSWWFNTWKVKNAIKKKLLHINKVQYHTTERLALYVFTDSFMDYESSDIKDVLEHIFPCQDICKISFDTIYIDDCGWFYECDMRRKRFRFFDTQSILRSINEDAKAFVDK